jgi:MoaA/NifB/PqqE/SkfB family radical SAM enzyme
LSKLLTKLPQYTIARRFNTPVPLPISYTLGLTYKCQAKCLTCRIYHKHTNEMSLDEWTQIFLQLEHAPYWVTFTGGEPFLYKNIVEVFNMLYKHCQPKIVNIPTNGQLVSKIVEDVVAMAQLCLMNTQIIVNVSLDHYIAEENDKIRGLKGYFTNAINTVNALQEKIKQKELTNVKVGIHTVISNFNIKSMNMIALHLSSLLDDPTHYITEIAEDRIELGTAGFNLSPSAKYYKSVVEYLRKAADGKRSLIRAFRLNYYNRVLNWLETHTNIPCYAGYSSCQITPTGDVWTCCVRTLNMGNIKAYDYDLKKLWNSALANDARQHVKSCLGCPLANVSYTNSLQDIPTMIRTAKELI